MAVFKRYFRIKFFLIAFSCLLATLYLPAGASAQIALPVNLAPVTDTVNGTLGQVETILAPLPIDLGPVTDTLGQLETTLPPLPVDLGPVTDTVNGTVDQLENTLPPTPPLPPLPELPPQLPTVDGLNPPLDLLDGPTVDLFNMLNSGTPEATALGEMLTMSAVMDNLAARANPGNNGAFRAAPADSSDWPISDNPAAMVLAALPLLGLVCAFIAISSYLNVARKLHWAQPQ